MEFGCLVDNVQYRFSIDIYDICEDCEIEIAVIMQSELESFWAFIVLLIKVIVFNQIFEFRLVEVIITVVFKDFSKSINYRMFKTIMEVAEFNIDQKTRN